MLPMASTPTVEEITAEVEAFVDANWDPDMAVRDWWQRLAKAGLIKPTLPVEAGGRAWPAPAAAAAGATLTRRRVLGPPGGLGMLLAAPTIASHGSPEQWQRLLPPLLDGTESWCQLFSEPGAGSDLAGLQCRAERDGDQWVITGQKVWTSNGHEADWGMLVARTDPDAPKHRGITYFAFPMRQAGVEVRPLVEMTGRAMFNEVFIDGARVSNDDVIGGLGEGWRVANTTLAFERAGIGGTGTGFGTASPGVLAGHLDRPVREFLGRRGETSAGGVGRRVLGLLGDEMRARGLSDDPTIRQDLARLHGLQRIMTYSAWRAKGTRSSPGVEGSLNKLLNTEMIQLARSLAGRILGPDVQIVGDGSAIGGVLQELILFSPAPSIYGGTDEIQRNVIGERGLGLPREPGPPSDTPFRELPKN
jgi:alkylation response protein AidB-like acyl-CoA dehydrogenase